MERTLQFRRDEAQYHEEATRTGQRFVGLSRLKPWITAATIAFFLSCVGVALGLEGAQPLAFWSLLAALVLLMLLQVLSQQAVLRGWTRRHSGLYEMQSLTISQHGIRAERSNFTIDAGWQAVSGFETTKLQVILFLNSGNVLSIPKSAFADDTELSAFLRMLHERIESEQIVDSVPTALVDGRAGSSGASNAGARFWRALQGNLVSGARMAAFLPPRSDSFHPAWAQFFALTAIQVSIILMFELGQTGLQGQFNLYALPGLMFGTVVALVAAWLLASLSGNGERTLTTLVAIASIAVTIEALTQALDVLPREFRLSSVAALRQWIPLCWFALAVSVAATRLLPIPTGWRALAAAATSFLLFTSTTAIHSDRGLWIPLPSESERAERERKFNALAQEDVFYMQSRLLDQQLDSIEAGRKGIVDLYFVGGAGYAGQDVFMKEVRSVSALFENRFGTKGRTVRLVNNADTASELPVASVTSLRKTLRRIAQVMDRDEDILFLFLTSHGSSEHRFTLDFWPLRFKELTPASLRRLLDESGIKRRVLVISACYSGGFVDALKSDDSLVIAAAAPDRNSFGCSNEADFTYFGKAYFDEALRDTHSFIEAFENAKPRIAERERASGHTPSEPQIFIGDAIRAPLAQLEQSLRAPRATAPVDMSEDARRSKDDQYARLTDIWLVPEVLKSYREECERSMAKVSPAHYVAKNPNHYGGLESSSPYWPRLMSAWHTYAEEYCAASNDERLFKSLYESGWRASLDPATADAVLRFLLTPTGARFVNAGAMTSINVSARVMEAALPAVDRAQAKLLAEQVEINRLFQRDRANSAR